MGEVADDHEEKWFDRHVNWRAGQMEELFTLSYDDVKHHTEKAVLFRVGDDDVWVPKSVIDVDYDDDAWDALKEMGPGEIDIAGWFAQKENL